MNMDLNELQTRLESQIRLLQDNLSQIEKFFKDNEKDYRYSQEAHIAIRKAKITCNEFLENPASYDFDKLMKLGKDLNDFGFYHNLVLLYHPLALLEIANKTKAVLYGKPDEALDLNRPKKKDSIIETLNSYCQKLSKAQHRERAVTEPSITNPQIGEHRRGGVAVAARERRANSEPQDISKQRKSPGSTHGH